jgi:lysophospholipase L1-like esterase
MEAHGSRQLSPFSSNPIRLSWREWSAAALACIIVLYLLPTACPAVGARLSRLDYRLPTELSSDYWMFEQFAERSHAKRQAAVLGDSVIWGQYAKSDDTLTHHLNSLLGEPVFANLGVDGLHPAAMAGLVAYYGGALENDPVLVHLNPLWMASAEQDLATEGEVRFNHPKLVPQVLNRPASYHPATAEAIGAVLERRVPFLSWKEHLKIAYCEGMAFPEWSVENPYSLLPAGRGPDSFPSDEPGSQPLTWRERGITTQNLPWVEASRSYQWRSFRRTIELLKSRRNRVFVLIGPFNTHALTAESQAHYQAATAAMAKWLIQEHVPYYAPSVLPTNLYADASHPLGAGYRRLAEELSSSASFREWRKSWASDGPRTRLEE